LKRGEVSALEKSRLGLAAFVKNALDLFLCIFTLFSHKSNTALFNQGGTMKLYKTDLRYISERNIVVGNLGGLSHIILAGWGALIKAGRRTRRTGLPAVTARAARSL
jgi:hypothetical protein